MMVINLFLRYTISLVKIIKFNFGVLASFFYIQRYCAVTLLTVTGSFLVDLSETPTFTLRFSPLSPTSMLCESQVLNQHNTYFYSSWQLLYFGTISEVLMSTGTVSYFGAVLLVHFNGFGKSKEARTLWQSVVYAILWYIWMKAELMHL